MRNTTMWIAFAAALVAFWLQAVAADTQDPELPAPDARIEGRWVGSTEIGEIQLPFSVVFTPGEDGCRATADMQGFFDLPLDGVTCRTDAVHFELAASIGRAVWDGKVEDGAIVGTFAQNFAVGTFRLEADVVPDPVAKAGPAPYTETDVTIDTGEVKLAGTATIPAGDGPHPGIVLLSGSGPQDRDEELFGFRPFRVLADAVARRGVAVLRFDDRGVGGSERGPDDATSASLANDAEAAVRTLRSHPAVDPRRVGIAGHSEGGILAPMVAQRNPDEIAFVVLLAAPAIPGGSLLRAQSRAILEAQGTPRTIIDAQLAKQGRMLDAVRTGEGWDALEREAAADVDAALALLPEDQREDAARRMHEQVDAQMAAARSPWMRFFVNYDPRPALVALKVPTLAVFGSLDTQVPPDTNVEPMRAAFAESANQAARVVVLEGLNHVFQKAGTGAPGEYAVLPKEFGPGLLDLVVDWVVETADSISRAGASPANAPSSSSSEAGGR